MTAVEESNTMDICIRTIQHGDHRIKVSKTANVDELKNAIHDKTGIETNRQRLIFQGKALVNEKTVSSYAIKDGMTVHMVARPVGIQPSSTTAENETSPPQPTATNIFQSLFRGRLQVQRNSNQANQQNGNRPSARIVVGTRISTSNALPLSNAMPFDAIQNSEFESIFPSLRENVNNSTSTNDNSNVRSAIIAQGFSIGRPGVVRQLSLSGNSGRVVFSRLGTSPPSQVVSAVTLRSSAQDVESVLNDLQQYQNRVQQGEPVDLGYVGRRVRSMANRLRTATKALDEFAQQCVSRRNLSGDYVSVDDRTQTLSQNGRGEASSSQVINESTPEPIKLNLDAGSNSTCTKVNSTEQDSNSANVSTTASATTNACNNSKVKQVKSDTSPNVKKSNLLSNSKVKGGVVGSTLNNSERNITNLERLMNTRSMQRNRSQRGASSIQDSTDNKNSNSATTSVSSFSNGNHSTLAKHDVGDKINSSNKKRLRGYSISSNKKQGSSSTATADNTSTTRRYNTEDGDNRRKRRRHNLQTSRSYTAGSVLNQNPRSLFTLGRWNRFVNDLQPSLRRIFEGAAKALDFSSLAIAESTDLQPPTSPVNTRASKRRKLNGNNSVQSSDLVNISDQIDSSKEENLDGASSTGKQRKTRKNEKGKSNSSAKKKK